MNRRLIVLVSLLVLFVLVYTSASAQALRKYKKYDVVDVIGGQKVEVLRSRGEGYAEEYEVIYYTTRRQEGRRAWVGAVRLNDEERQAKLAKQISNTGEVVGQQTKPLSPKPVSVTSISSDRLTQLIKPTIAEERAAAMEAQAAFAREIRQLDAARRSTVDTFLARVQDELIATDSSTNTTENNNAVSRFEGRAKEIPESNQVLGVGKNEPSTNSVALVSDKNSPEKGTTERITLPDSLKVNVVAAQDKGDGKTLQGQPNVVKIAEADTVLHQLKQEKLPGDSLQLVTKSKAYTLEAGKFSVATTGKSLAEQIKELDAARKSTVDSFVLKLQREKQQRDSLENIAKINAGEHKLINASLPADSIADNISDAAAPKSDSLLLPKSMKDTVGKVESNVLQTTTENPKISIGAPGRILVFTKDSSNLARYIEISAVKEKLALDVEVSDNKEPNKSYQPSSIDSAVVIQRVLQNGQLGNTDSILPITSSNISDTAIIDGAIDESKDEKKIEVEKWPVAAADTLSEKTVMSSLVAAKALLPVKEEVDVFRNGEWLAAYIMARKGESLYKVHYHGKSEKEDEWVTQAQLRPATVVRNLPVTTTNESVQVAKVEKLTPASCNFNAPVPPVSDADQFSVNLAKRKIFEGYLKSVAAKKAAPKVGLSFEEVKAAEPFVNTVSFSSNYALEVKYTMAPAGALVYPISAKMKVCQQQGNEIQQNIITANWACFRNKEGKWVAFKL